MNLSSAHWKQRKDTLSQTPKYKITRTTSIIVVIIIIISSTIINIIQRPLLTSHFHPTHSQHYNYDEEAVLRL